MEPAAWKWTSISVLGSVALLGLVACMMLKPVSKDLGPRLRAAGVGGDPEADGKNIGALATLIAHAFVAKSERPERQALASPGGPSGPAATSYVEQIVLIQSESFFDVRRIWPSLNAGFLSEFDRCCQSSRQCGMLAVPCWGANTVRTEFSVLTGLADSATGLDRFNPYHRFARAPLASLPQKLRQRGYKTVCLHPFDRRFYGRDAIMPLLGFDTFIGEEAFVGSKRENGFVADAEVGDRIAQILRDEVQKIFMFVITMENHGPWMVATGEGSAPKLLRTEECDPTEHAAIELYLRSVRNADRMLGRVRSDLEKNGRSSLLGFYGDHLPSFPRTLGRHCAPSPDTDYVLWSSGGGNGMKKDLRAENLGDAVLLASNAPTIFTA